MAGPEFDIEFAPPVLSRCQCCGGLSVRLTRLVKRRGVTRAAYALNYENHAEAPLRMLISIGPWFDDSRASERVAFFCHVRFPNDGAEVSLRDAAHSPWSDETMWGKHLPVEAARAHALKAEAFEIFDAAMARDPSLRGYASRSECGELAIPLEYSFNAPDEIHALGEQRRERATEGKAFASLDGKRFFIRCLLPVSVDGYDVWSVGVWVEVQERDWQHIREVWDDLERYRLVRFTGQLANNVASELGLPVKQGATVTLTVPDPNTPPRVQAPTLPRWEREAFEEFAVGRGFL